MTSPRRRQDSPVEFVTLKIAFKADKKMAISIKEAFPSAKVRNGECEFRIEAEKPAEVTEKARELLEKIRSII
jgi:hypothetical protein